MFLAIAVLLIHPQLATTVSMPADKAALDAQTAVTASAISAEPENFSLTAEASLDASSQPVTAANEVLPDAPVPMASLTTPAPMAFLKPAKPMTVSVAQLQAEDRRKEFMWKGLIIASSGAATFDAWATRHAITTSGAQELNPLLRPFAGNSSLYAAIQVGPALLDFAGRKMMYSRHPWVRRMWWVPQSASFVSSIFCGAHNLAYH
ncbi:MAG TPA: hypothetical protein VK770_02070 [Candidatus Acidoferrum sp.]|jgi:hypothetical protein|nr:hypothetical protein [Candidatus Acidoferrum sp.]